MKFIPKLSRNSIVIWFCILIPVLFAIQFAQAKKPISKSESYTSFLSKLENAQFKEVIFLKDGRVIRGILKTPIDSAAVKYTAVQTDLPVWNSDIIFAKVEAAKVPIRAVPNVETPLSLLVKLIPTLILLGFVIYIIRSSNSPNRVSSMFNKTSNKLVKEIPKITFADVAGADEAKQELREMVDFLKNPAEITSLGGTIPKGALLIGPPGTGKTLLARAVAGEAQRPFFSMSGSDFVEMFVGVGASRVRGLFEAAKPHAPCIIFIDEIDAVGRTRGTGTGGGSDEREQTLNQLLVEMDGFTPSVGIIVLAATNRPDVLDSALLRPGRFDRQVNIDLPDIKGREAILAVHAKRHPMSSDIVLRQIARGTPGFSGADLANLLNEAALFGARNGRKEITPVDLEAAKDKMILGLERRSMVLSPAERSLTAFHEAGHAIVSLITAGADPLHKVTIIPRGRALGVTASLPDVDRHTYSRRWLMDHLVMLFGGRAAEEIVLGKDGITTGAQNDIERATDIARRYVTSFGMSDLVGMMNVPEAAPEGHLAGSTRAVASEKTRELIDDEVRGLLRDAYKSAMDLLNRHKKSLETLAQGLLDRETLSAQEIMALLPDLAALPHHEPSAPLMPPPPLLTA